MPLWPNPEPETPPRLLRNDTPPAPHLGRQIIVGNDRSSPRRSNRVSARSATDPNSVRQDLRSEHSSSKDFTFTYDLIDNGPATPLSSDDSRPSSPELIPHRPRLDPVAEDGLVFTDAAPTTRTPVRSHRPIAPRSLHRKDMPPSPTKTPRKRLAAQSVSRPSDQEAAVSQARLEQLASPNKRRHAFTKSSAKKAETIKIYTDPRDRLPEDNMADPFMPSKENAVGVPATRSSQRQADSLAAQRDRQMQEAVEKNQGVIYMFRGKKFFRRYDDLDAVDKAAPQGSLIDDATAAEFEQRAGVDRNRRLTRSGYKPRLLFPKNGEIDAGSDQAVTTANATPSGSRRGRASADTSQEGMDDLAEDYRVGRHRTIQSPRRSARGSPFDGWPRTKSRASSSRTVHEQGDTVMKDVDEAV